MRSPLHKACSWFPIRWDLETLVLRTSRSRLQCQRTLLPLHKDSRAQSSSSSWPGPCPPCWTGNARGWDPDSPTGWMPDRRYLRWAPLCLPLGPPGPVCSHSGWGAGLRDTWRSLWCLLNCCYHLPLLVLSVSDTKRRLSLFTLMESQASRVGGKLEYRSSPSC